MNRLIISLLTLFLGCSTVLWAGPIKESKTDTPIEFYTAPSGVITKAATITASGQLQTTGVYQAPNGTAASPAFGFSSSGNTDNGMYLVGSDQLGMSTAGTNRLTIDASGKLVQKGAVASAFGGTASWNTDSSGGSGFEARDYNGSAQSRFGWTSADGNFIWTTNPGTTFKIGVNNAAAITIDSNSKVGIGTSPSAVFHVYANTSSINGAIIENQHDTGQALVVKGGTAGQTVMSITDKTAAAANTTTFTANGKVGIGAVPTVKLFVSETGGDNAVAEFKTNHASAATIDLRNGGGVGRIGTTYSSVQIDAGADGTNMVVDNGYVNVGSVLRMGVIAGNGVGLWHISASGAYSCTVQCTNTGNVPAAFHNASGVCIQGWRAASGAVRGCSDTTNEAHRCLCAAMY